MKDPVILVESGHTYERAAITQWIKTENTCPLTRTPLKTKMLTSNCAIKSGIEEWRVKQQKEKSVAKAAVVISIEDGREGTSENRMQHQQGKKPESVVVVASSTKKRPVGRLNGEGPSVTQKNLNAEESERQIAEAAIEGSLRQRKEQRQASQRQRKEEQQVEILAASVRSDFDEQDQETENLQVVFFPYCHRVFRKKT